MEVTSEPSVEPIPNAQWIWSSDLMQKTLGRATLTNVGKPVTAFRATGQFIGSGNGTYIVGLGDDVHFYPLEDGSPIGEVTIHWTDSEGAEHTETLQASI